MIGALVALLSLEVTRRLVAAGTVYATLSVTGASNTTPIVVQTPTPHGLIRPAHGVVAGVGGNTNANGVWICTPTDSTHLKLTGFDRQGTFVNSVGNASFTTGGTIQIAFPDGSILLGRRNVAMATAVASPRIVFVPIESPAWGLDPYGGVIPPATLPNKQSAQTAEQITMLQSRQLATERQRFEVHVTGCASPPEPDFGDFDVTQAIYQTLYATMFDIISPDRARVLAGKWVSQGNDIQVLDVRGQKWVGIVEIAQPVIANPLAFVPSGVIATLIVQMPGATAPDQTTIVLPPAPT
jgi:hypothetical protein